MMANYEMQCKKCGYMCDYSSKTKLCDACEIKSLKSQLTIARTALEAVKGHAHLVDSFPCCKFDQPLNIYDYLRAGHRCAAAICDKALKDMEKVK